MFFDEFRSVSLQRPKWSRAQCTYLRWEPHHVDVTSPFKHTLLGAWPIRGDLAVLRSCHVCGNTNHVVVTLWRVFVSRWSDRVQNGSQVQSIRATTASELLGDGWSQRRVPPSGPQSFHICSIMDSEQALCRNEMFLLLTFRHPEECFPLQVDFQKSILWMQNLNYQTEWYCHDFLGLIRCLFNSERCFLAALILIYNE